MLPADNLVRIELQEGIPIFKATRAVQKRIELLLAKQRQEGLTTAEREEFDGYEELDDYLSFANRIIRNLILEEQRLGMVSPHERDVRTERVPQSDSRTGFLSIDPERFGGVPCFVGTRVPIKYLWEYLMKGETLEAFLDDFEGVPREEALAALEQAYERLLEGLPRQ